MEKIFETLALVAALFMGVLWLASPTAQADEPTTIVKSMRDEFACPGMHAEWLDAHTVQCLREKP